MEYESVKNYAEHVQQHPVTQFLSLIFLSYIALNVVKNLIEWIKNYGKWPPGPIGLPIFGYLPFLGPEPHRTLWKMKEKYGDIMSLYMGTKYTIIINDFDIGKEVLCHPAALDRAPDLFKNLPRIGFQVENGASWTEQRRFCLSASRDLGLGRNQWEDLMMDEVKNFIEDLRKTRGVSTDISRVMSMSISSNIISLLIGRKFTKEEEADKIQLSLNFAKVAFNSMGPSDPASLVPGLRKVLELCGIGIYKQAEHVIKNFGIFVRDEIAKHKTSEFNDVHDFINKYLNEIRKLSMNTNMHHYFSEEMLEGNLSILFLGSSDTVFSSLGWLFRLMSDNKDVQAKVYAEIMDVLGKDGEAKYAERDRIPYTFAVLMEAQRFSTIVPLSTTRKLTQDISIKGLVLPKGAEVCVNLWGVHNDTNYWKQPEKFIPERFLTDNGTKLVKQPDHYAPFSIGKRNCPGETIAWREILGYFTEVVKNFEISTTHGVSSEYKIVNGLVTHLVPEPICFKERK